MISGGDWISDEWPGSMTRFVIRGPDADTETKRKATDPFACERLHRGDWPQIDPLLWEGDQA